ncbi:response regulator [Rhodoferax sp. AJA081-3]|uniref:response regulator n=1 Tax=Rhodoferax sp. AJA081-3 TaxID=2752316 RepID=UPI001ADFEA99|nr:response regulator [Rhodoferax sp. AJA081-3]QTN26545.1 response regulator [Rhodoferax sp. AJA081-3]
MNTKATALGKQHILVVEDDTKIADMLTNYLHMHGFETTVCSNGLDAVPLVRAITPALVVLDLMLPGQDGIAVCEQLRAFSAVPIIMVTARVDEIDRLLGLDTGADDYVCKPFSPREVVARIQALLRRAQGSLSAQAHHAAPNSVTAPAAAALVADDTTLSIRWNGQLLPLTPVEFRLLRLLMSRPSHVFSRARLLDHVHHDLRDVSDRAIDSHIKNLRRKLDAAGAVGHSVASVYGVGYRFEVD